MRSRCSAYLRAGARFVYCSLRLPVLRRNASHTTDTTNTNTKTNTSSTRDFQCESIRPNVRTLTYKCLDALLGNDALLDATILKTCALVRSCLAYACILLANLRCSVRRFACLLASGRELPQKADAAVLRWIFVVVASVRLLWCTDNVLFALEVRIFSLCSPSESQQVLIQGERVFLEFFIVSKMPIFSRHTETYTAALLKSMDASQVKQCKSGQYVRTCASLVSFSFSAVWKREEARCTEAI